MDLKEIKAIIELMTKNQISEFDLEKEGYKIRIKKAGESAQNHAIYQNFPPVGAGFPQISHFEPKVSSAPQGVASEASAQNIVEIKSPMVGTFYRSPSPDAAPYVEVGKQINQDTVVCIVEAMKVMNEIKAEVSGTITEVLAENGKSVEFGQVLFRVKTS